MKRNEMKRKESEETKRQVSKTCICGGSGAWPVLVDEFVDKMYRYVLHFICLFSQAAQRVITSAITVWFHLFKSQPTSGGFS